MIPKAVVQRFLKMPCDDHRWMKALTLPEVDAALKTLRPAPSLSPEFRLHQKVGFLLGVAYPQFGFWYDMGLGKTLLTLELLRYWWEQKRIRRALIFIKSDKAFPTWEAQIERWGIDIPYVLLDESASAKKWAALAHFRRGLIIVPYAGARAMCSKRAPNKRGKNKMRLDLGLVEKLAENLDAMVLDESTSAAHDSLTTKLCLALRDHNPQMFVYALAGRPFGRDPDMLWAQYYLLDQGRTLGATKGLFRAAFYNEQENPWSRGGWGKIYKFSQRMMPAFMRRVQHRSIAYAEAECLDVPAYQSIVERVPLPEEAEAYFQRVIQEIIDANGDLGATKNAFMRARQLSSGFMGFSNDETGERVQITFEQNPKLDRALDILDELPDGRKAVVFYAFTLSGRRLHESLKDIGREGIWLWSGTKNYAAELRRFLTDPKCTVAVINNQVGAYSLDGLQHVANYLMFYESPVSVIDRDQAEKRVRRQGQKRKVFVYDLVVTGTLDERILQFHRAGDDMLKALRADPRKLLDLPK